MSRWSTALAGLLHQRVRQPCWWNKTTADLTGRGSIERNCNLDAGRRGSCRCWCCTLVPTSTEQQRFAGRDPIDGGHGCKGGTQGFGIETLYMTKGSWCVWTKEGYTLQIKRTYMVTAHRLSGTAFVLDGITERRKLDTATFILLSYLACLVRHGRMYE